MTPKHFQTKFLAAFVLLFVCLNAGGAVCVAYCRSVVLAAADDHCPLKKKERHCDRAEPTNDGEAFVAIEAIDCCPMIVSFVPGTHETKRTFSTATATVPASNFETTQAIVVSPYRFANIPAYRGPPKNERVLHITNRVLRI